MTDIDVLLTETRKFQPPPDFARAANVPSPEIYDEADGDYEKFWAEQAGELEWIKPWKKVLEWKPPHAQWFTGGKLNIAVNCVDRHIRGPRRNKAALIWEGEPGDKRTLTYWDLYREISKFANVLKKLGVRKGDRVAIYLPLIPEAAISMLACARIGAIHSVVFGGFSPESLSDRINDSKVKVLITAFWMSLNFISSGIAQRPPMTRTARSRKLTTPSSQRRGNAGALRIQAARSTRSTTRCRAAPRSTLRPLQECSWFACRRCGTSKLADGHWERS